MAHLFPECEDIQESEMNINKALIKISHESSDLPYSKEHYNSSPLFTYHEKIFQKTKFYFHLLYESCEQNITEELLETLNFKTNKKIPEKIDKEFFSFSYIFEVII